VAGLLYLQHAFDLSDEAVVARWVENPYYQHLCGEAFGDRSVHWTDL
jgi:IS5 family transposase